ncbi:MAG: adenosylmethionine decarboxylase [Thaumarchaeota archaeon]|nr:adenosylmethionine decarboxylase [Candidatus Calditenuaceae archaeon]MDW8187126.1 adenosylmethionine decarboxylase [Nitrososphaerota archaeon]
MGERVKRNRSTLVLREGKEIIGKHVYGNLYGCDRSALWDEELLEKTVREAIQVARVNLLELRKWKLNGPKGGVSILAIVTESHIAIHTWPEYGYATVDVFTCGEKSDPMAAFELISGLLKPTKIVKHYANRSSVVTEVR